MFARSRLRAVTASAPSRRQRTIEVSAWAVIAVAAAGAWIGHAVEYLRVFGRAGFGTTAARSAHAYMGPLGLALLAIAVGGAYASILARRRLERLLVLPAEARPSLAFPWLLWTVWLLQLALYVVQENAEARAIGVNLHGWQAVTGVHQWAPLVQLCVAATGTAVLWTLRRPVTRLARAVRAAVAAFHARRPATAVRNPQLSSVWSAEARWGVLRWCRPPPLAAHAA
jgi:hypothetical protein